jgi:hypothetical protein
MSTQATIRNIAPVHNGIGIVPLPEACRVPENAKVVELKYCELCGRSFPRKFAPTEVFEIRKTRYYSVAGYSDERPAELRRDKGQRLCSTCARQPSLELNAEELLREQEAYRQQMPGTEIQMRHALHLPKYRTQTSVQVIPRKKRKWRDCSTWTQLIFEAFAKKPELTMVEICDALPGCLTPVEATHYCHRVHIPLKKVRRISTGFPGGCFVFALEVN